MYYDKEEYTDEVDWFAGLITAVARGEMEAHSRKRG